MNKLAKLVFAASAIVAMSAQAQTDIKASTPNSAYAQATNGTIVRNSTGLCSVSYTHLTLPTTPYV